MSLNTICRVVVSASLLAVFSNETSARRAQSNADAVLLRVNGEAFTQTDLADRELWNYRQRASTLFPQTILDAVNSLAVVQHGRAVGYAMTDQMFRDLIATQMKINHLQTEEQWRAAFAREGFGNVEDFRREKEREMIIHRVEQDEMDKVPITDAEARAYYRQHSGQSTATPTAEALATIKAHAITDTRRQAWNDVVARLRSAARLEFPIAAVKRAYDEAVARATTPSLR